MKVRFVRSGGFSGIRLGVTLDTEALPPGEADRLDSLVAAASFFDQPASLTSPGRGADCCQYLVTVEDGDRKKQVDMDDLSVPDVLRPLLEYLLESARTARMKK